MSKAYILVAMEDEWITITSPGGLPDHLSEEEYLMGQVYILRNPIIANVFYRLQLVESFGTGIRRIKSSYHASKKKPIFTIYENSIEIKLPVISQLDRLSDDQQRVYRVIEHHAHPSSFIVEETGFGKNKVLEIIEDLIINGYVIKQGSGQGTKYRSK